MFRLFARAKRAVFHKMTATPDLSDQYAELLIEVWAQERFERTHPFTCAAIRRSAIGPESRRVGARRR
jgi:hypothetical protein